MSLEFVHSLSPWLLFKIIYAYEAYLYDGRFSVVLLTFYAYKLLYMIAYVLDEEKHSTYFYGLGTLYESGDHLDVISVVLGDLILGFLGILLACVQTKLIKCWTGFITYAPEHSYEIKSYNDTKLRFRTVHQWQELFKEVNCNDLYDIRHKSIYLSQLTQVDDAKRGKRACCATSKRCLPIKRSLKAIKTKLKRGYGVLSLKTIFGCKECPYKWKHRKFYWIYLLQAILLASFSLAIYTFGSESHYFFFYILVHASLTALFYLWNRYYADKYANITTIEEFNDAEYLDLRYLYAIRLFTFITFCLPHVRRLWYPGPIIYITWVVLFALTCMMRLIILFVHYFTESLVYATYLSLNCDAVRDLT